jgi:acetate kinase
MSAHHLLIFNCGSSSLNYKLYRAEDLENLQLLVWGKAHHVGVKSQEDAYLVHNTSHGQNKEIKPLADHRSAAQAVLNFLKQAGYPVSLIGHRFVHGGVAFSQATLLTSENMPALEATIPLAPIHNPNSLSVIALCQQMLPTVPQYAAFDTAFHASMPEKAWRYALPESLYQTYGYRKFGFHGLSYQYICYQASRALERPLEDLKIIACHLGTGGSSAAAVQHGHCLDTSMGYTPLQGLIMSTRCGDLDPAVVLDLIEAQGKSPAEVNRLLNKESGLLGISGFSSDLFELAARAEAGDTRAELAVDMYVHRLKSYIGAYLAVLGGADALIFTDDIGLRCWQVRAKVCNGLEPLGIVLDEQANRQSSERHTSIISAPTSPVSIFSIPTDEETIIGLQGLKLIPQI